jgi:hypothetical protein
MAEFFDSLTQDHVAMIDRQPVFFVATAAADGRINLSPKGLAGTFQVLSPSRVAYLDLAGSGNETHAHLAADGRITLMMCNFEAPALILRIYGRGRPVLPADPEWEGLAARFAYGKGVTLPGCDHFSAIPHGLTKAAVFDFLDGVDDEDPWGR